ncbi:xylose operon transcription regulator XylR [Coraliomargarita akajimensis]|uniref:Transcriptional regulator, AraC family n=1 Tax=Coraliomargarita akajimensis (strain DSM 45221 / IAM 15411 / JCM 23193 / KCTC 12865 / 04OKA010-24) TaxID=583355 RepID=D5EQS6_CORAD|nr:DNA-binding transcriptional regulator [Coraliomargarita akajimensis]ADE53919.1 transcriptional regulator, AraC family [Coraliomargarita akajimensis DSM 45221]
MIHRQPNVLMMIESSRESGRKLIDGITQYARHFGPWTINWKPTGVRGLAALNRQSNFDGILARDVAEVRDLVKAGIPAVIFTYTKQSMPGTVFVSADDEQIGRQVAREYLDRGFKHFAFCGQTNAPWAEKRGHCFESALEEAGFEVAHCWMEPAMLDDDAIPEDTNRVRDWLSALPKPVGIMAGNDDIGQWVVQLCQSIGLRVPDDCAVIGVDNDPVVCGVCDPPLSSVNLDQMQAGYRAAAALHKLMNGEQPESNRITASVGELVIRQSSDIMAIEDVAIAKAVRFMQRNAARPVTVDQIAEASGLFRRGLERRFRKGLGQSVQQRFHEVRAAHLAKLLSETQLTIEEIAEQCGFNQASHLSRFFSSVRGETPSAYRRRSGGVK